MLAGVNKRDQIQNEKSTLKSRFGSVVDLEEKKEVEKHRVNMTNQLRELVRLDLTTIRKFFRDSDPYKTGYVSQRQFREALSLVNIPIEVLVTSSYCTLLNFLNFRQRSTRNLVHGTKNVSYMLLMAQKGCALVHSRSTSCGCR